MTDDLVPWLRAQLDDDERKVAAMEREAERARTAPIFQGYPPNWLAGVDIFVSPTRWQAEIDAKRQTLALAEAQVSVQRGSGAEVRQWKLGLEMLRLLALPYADRPGYREEWRP